MTDRSWARLTVVRLGLAVPVLVGLIAIGGSHARGAAFATIGAWIAAVLALEGGRRWARLSAPALVLPLLMADGVMMAVAIAHSGGAASPVLLVVVAHLIAAAFTAAPRAGVVLASWQAGLLLVVEVPSGGVAAYPPTTVGMAAVLVAVGVVATGAAVLEHRVDRRDRERVEGQVRLLGRLEAATTVHQVCETLADHVVRTGFARCAVVLAAPHRVVGAVGTADGPPLLVDAPASSEPGVLLTADRPADEVLQRHLDPEHDPLLDTLLPGATNVVGVPVVVDGRSCGVVAAEWSGGGRARISDRAVQALRRDAAHAGLALRSVLLLDDVERRSRRDVLTELVNRLGFEEALDREIARSDREGTAVTLALVDLDHFKAVNDGQGHQTGDRVLALVGASLERSTRGHDIAARIGGDEFAMVLPATDLPAAQVVADRARREIADAVGAHGVTASIGLASAPSQGLSRAALVRAADEALYEAKNAGRNRTVVSSADELEAILVLPDRADPRRPIRRQDLRSSIAHPAGRV